MTVNTLTHARYGPMLVNAHDLYVGEAFVHCGEYGEEEVQFLKRFVAPGDVAVMAGANIGSLVVPIAQHIGEQGRVVAFEPQLYVYHLLCANLALNDLFNVEAFRYAVGDTMGVVPIPRLDPRQKNNGGGVSVGHGQDAVPCLTIDSLGLQRCDLIQADVEGSELALLRGATETIRAFLPMLYLEADRADQRGALLTWLVEAGYHVWEHQPRLWNPENINGRTDVLWENVVSINWLCLHPDNETHFDVRPSTLGGPDEIVQDYPELRRLWPK